MGIEAYFYYVNIILFTIAVLVKIVFKINSHFVSCNRVRAFRLLFTFQRSYHAKASTVHLTEADLEVRQTTT